jgi:hypothetical protein
LVLRELTRVGDVVVGDGPDLIGADRHECGRRAVKKEELQLVSLARAVRMYDRANISGLQALVGEVGG